MKRSSFLTVVCLMIVLVLISFTSRSSSHISPQITTLNTTEAGEIIDMNSDKTKFIEVNGIQFETIMPERRVIMPPNQPGAKSTVEFGIRITNKTEVPHRFSLFFIRPIFSCADKQRLPKLGPTVNGSYDPSLSDLQLLSPGESFYFQVEGYFSYAKNKLRFTFREKNGIQWTFYDFSSGTYWIQVSYQNPYSTWEAKSVDLGDNTIMQPVGEQRIYNNPKSDALKVEDVWTGELSTPLVKFQIF